MLGIIIIVVIIVITIAVVVVVVVVVVCSIVWEIHLLNQSCDCWPKSIDDFLMSS